MPREWTTGTPRSSIGLVVQAVDEAWPDGLTVTELGERTKLEPEVLVDVLAICVTRDFVKRVERYYRKR